MNDIEELTRLNIEIGNAESRGDKNWLNEHIAPRLAFRRANKEKTVDCREEFLDKVKQSDDRKTEVQSVEIHGDTAVVKCIVIVNTKGDPKYQNLRLFVREPDGWKLLGWANEPL